MWIRHSVPATVPSGRLTGDQGIVTEPLISSCVVNNEGPLLQNGMPAERDVTRGFAHADALAGEEPLALAIQQAYQGHRDLKGFTGQPRQAFKTLIVTGIKKAGNIQGLQPLFFILRYTGCLHVISWYVQSIYADEKVFGSD
ncbi:hypothetical protein VEE47_45140 (plasmid) [Escherichia coli]|nr:hypothetical protein VEE47_45140 [Escherichia coli]